MRDMLDGMNAKLEDMARQLAQISTTQNSIPPHLSKSSYAAVASNPRTTKPQLAPKFIPPPRSFLSGLSPKRVVIHSNPLNTTIKDIPAPALVQKANETLEAMDAKVEGELVTVRGVNFLPSGDVSFYAQNCQHQKWLMDNKHTWSKKVHPDLEASPSTFSVMIHGIPKSFNITSKVSIDRLASENKFQASEVARVCWMGSNLPSEKKAGTIILSFLNKDLALRIERSGIFNNFEVHRTEKFKPHPPQCYQCLRVGHFGRWCCKSPKCAKCGGKHPTNKCPDGPGNVSTCVLCTEGLKSRTPGVSDVSHTPFNIVCPFKQGWFNKRPLPRSC